MSKTQQPQAPEITPKEELELFHRIEAAEVTKRLAFREMNRTKDAAKFARDAFNAATEEVHKLAGARTEPYPLLVQEEDEGGEEEGNGNSEETGDVPSSVTFANPADKATLHKMAETLKGNDQPTPTWHTYSLDAAAFNPWQVEALKDAGIDTLGQLKAAIDAHTTKAGWRRAARLGKGTGLAIEQAFAKYLEEIHADVSEPAATGE